MELLAHLRTRLTARVLSILTTTTFCEGCGEVCTAACRHEALRERNDRRVQDINLSLR